jgi:hypothetical protein
MRVGHKNQEKTMNKTRRTIDEIFELPSEHRHFIAGGSQSSPIPRDGVATEPSAAIRLSQEGRNQADFDNPEGSLNNQPSGRKPRIRERSHHRKSDQGWDARPVQGGRRMYLVPLTTRVKLETSDLLRRVVLENRLREEGPSTVQEIVELAVTQWLVLEGFLKSEST